MKQVILDDIKKTLNEHYEKGLAEASPEHGYHYRSQFVEFSINRSDGPDKSATTILMPARSYRVIKEGYRGVHYPMYYVELAVR